MVDSDSLALVGAAGFAYLAIREFTGPSEQAETFKDAREEVIGDMNEELEQELSQLEYEQHIIDYRSRYAQRREYLGSEYHDDFPEVEDLKSRFSDRSKEDTAYLWKSWFLAINNVAIAEEVGGGWWSRIPPWELIFIALLIGACYKGLCGAVIEKGKNVYERYRDPEDEFGQRWFSSSAYFNALESAGEGGTVRNAFPGPYEPAQSVYNEPEPIEDGGGSGEQPETVAEVPTSNALDEFPDRAEEAVRGALEISASSVIVITDTTLDTLDTIVEGNVREFGPLEWAVLVLAVLAFAAIATSTSWTVVGPTVGAIVISGAAAVLGVQLRKDKMEEVAPDVRKTIQIKES
jgi:hypothetical protein